MNHLMLAFSNVLITQGISCLLKTKGILLTEEITGLPELQKRVMGSKPDVVITDFYVLMNFLHDVPPETRVLLLDTGCGEENINYAFLSRNISGVLKMDSTEDDLVKAIQHVREGRLWIDRRGTKHLLAAVTDLQKFVILTEKEKEVLTLLGKGMDEVLISQSMQLNRRTVRYHIENAGRKIGVHDQRKLSLLSMQLQEYARAAERKAEAT